MNLPARTVLIPELWRYEAGEGMRQISITEYKQFCGRAGRPGYDEYGHAITIARREEEKEIIIEKYIKGKPERIWSRLGNEKHLRSHTLALISSTNGITWEELKALFSKTLFAYQYGTYNTEIKLDRAVSFLIDNNFVNLAGNNLFATKIGRRTAQLYIDPLTAVRIIYFVEKIKEDKESDIPLIYAICSTPDAPNISLRVPKQKVENFLREVEEEVYEMYDEAVDYEEIIDNLKMTMVMKAWIEEASEQELYERYKIEPGDLAVLRERGAWIAYAASELAKLLGKTRIATRFSVLSRRIEEGVREELLPLAQLRGIGRVRARQLYNRGYRRLDDLRRASEEELALVPSIGSKLAKSIKEQLL